MDPNLSERIMIIEEIENFPAIELVNAYSQYGTVFLDSANQRSSLGRYSFVAIDPFHILQ